MATRGSIPRLMELAGIEMLPPRAGVPTVRRELLGDASGEVVVAGRLGTLVDQTEFGIDLACTAWRARAPMVQRIVSMSEAGVFVAESTFDPHGQPFLDHHRIDGTAVLPGVMGVELMAEVAALPLPGRTVTAIENVDFTAPFKFYRDEPRTIRVEARFTEDGGDVVAHCLLIGERTLAGQTESQVTTHFTADVRLAGKPSPPPVADVPASPGAGAIDARDIRAVYFHGPSFQVLQSAWHDGSRTVGRFAEGLPPACAPAEAGLLTQPRLVELCFQTVGVAELGSSGRLALPARVSRIELHAPSHEDVACRALAVRAEGGAFDVTAVDSGGQVLVEVRGYQTVEVPLSVDEKLLDPFRTAAAILP